MSGKMPVNARNLTRAQTSVSKPVPHGKGSSSTLGLSEMNGAQTEDEKIEAMFKAGADQWAQQQQDMAK